MCRFYELSCFGVWSLIVSPVYLFRETKLFIFPNTQSHLTTPKRQATMHKIKTFKTQTTRGYRERDARRERRIKNGMRALFAYCWLNPCRLCSIFMHALRLLPFLLSLFVLKNFIGETNSQFNIRMQWTNVLEAEQSGSDGCPYFCRKKTTSIQLTWLRVIFA